MTDQLYSWEYTAGKRSCHESRDENVKSGQVTYAVRDTIINEKRSKRGDYMGIGDSGIISVGKDRDETLKEMLSKLVDEDSALISLYYGDEITEKKPKK